MTLISWRDEFSVGVDAVDHEHREMIGMINGVYAQLGASSEAEEIESCLEEIFTTPGAARHVLILGDPGAGKTTVLRSLMGLKQPAAGQISIDGTDIWQAGKELLHKRASSASLRRPRGS